MKIYDNFVIDDINEEIKKIKENLPVRNVNADDIYMFTVELCNNKVDRDNECFTSESLYRLAQMAIGKSGIFENTNDVARIYDTKVIETDEMLETGETLKLLMAKAIIYKSHENEQLIAEIENGIKDNVSISCSILSKTCSICGSNPIDCSHYKGHIYNDKLCYHELNDPIDFYEWSFVAPAVPTRMDNYVPNGIIKTPNLKSKLNKLDELKRQIAILNDIVVELEDEIEKLQSIP